MIMKEEWTSFVTNFNKSKRPIFEAAIRIFNNEVKQEVLYICDEAYWNNGHLDDKMNSLHCKDNRDLSRFWRIFEQIK